MDILFVQAGGTIDKGYPQGKDNHGYGFVVGEPAFVSILKRARPAYGWTTQSVVRKDSLDMTDDDRELIKKAVAADNHYKVVVTHGTDTIKLTAEVLSEIPGKTIVLTGAYDPEKFRDSDADFNLGMAVAAVQCLPPGVYLALGGLVKKWSDFKV